MPPPTLQLTLDPDAQAELERRYHTTHDARRVASHERCKRLRTQAPM